ncbi:MAG: ferredoxin-type protein NapF [Colwellia sp.]
MEPIVDPSKRRFLRGKITTPKVMRLPWVISEAVFISACNQCQDCLISCESNIIVKDEEGFPKIDFSQGECTFCNKCIDVCQQPLFSGSFTQPSERDESAPKPWPVYLEISDNCLAKNNVYCQSCRDECETSVIKFNYLTSSIPQPSINTVDCSQCGACLKSCPQDALTFNFS